MWRERAQLAQCGWINCVLGARAVCAVRNLGAHSCGLCAANLRGGHTEMKRHTTHAHNAQDFFARARANNLRTTTTRTRV